MGGKVPCTKVPTSWPSELEGSGVSGCWFDKERRIDGSHTPSWTRCVRATVNTIRNQHANADVMEVFD